MTAPEKPESEPACTEGPAKVELWMLDAGHRIIHGKRPHSEWDGNRPEHLPVEACEWAAMAIADLHAAHLRGIAGVDVERTPAGPEPDCSECFGRPGNHSAMCSKAAGPETSAAPIDGCAPWCDGVILKGRACACGMLVQVGAPEPSAASVEPLWSEQCEAILGASSSPRGGAGDGEDASALAEKIRVEAFSRQLVDGVAPSYYLDVVKAAALIQQHTAALTQEVEYQRWRADHNYAQSMRLKALAADCEAEHPPEPWAKKLQEELDTNASEVMRLQGELAEAMESEGDFEHSAELHSSLNRRAAKALGKPFEGAGSSWHDIPEQIEALRAVARGMLEALRLLKIRIHYVGMPLEIWLNGRPDWSVEIAALEAAISQAESVLSPTPAEPQQEVIDWSDMQRCADLAAKVHELEAALASKIGPDWREALPYESEFELRAEVERLRADNEGVWSHNAGLRKELAKVTNQVSSYAGMARKAEAEVARLRAELAKQ